MKQVAYDVAVIGSGAAGLTAAALLSQRGYRVLVAEKLPFIGGRCATLEYQGFKLPTGVIWVTREVHGEVCREVGAEFELRPAEPQYVLRVEGRDYEMPPSGIFRAMVSRLARDEAEAGRVMEAFKRALTWAEPSRSLSLKDWLLQYTDNPDVLGVFNFFVVMDTGLNFFELPAGEFFRFIRETSWVKTGGFLPQGGGSFTSALAGAIKRNGGEVWTRCRAERILVEGGRVKGVVVRKEGESVEVRCRAVVSNAGPRATVELAGRENFDPGYLEDVARIKGSPQIIIFIASDRPLVEWRGMVALPRFRRAFVLIPISNICPEMAPPGKHLLEVACCLTRSDPPYDLRSEIDLSLLDLRENIPGFEEARILRVNCYYGDWPLMRTWAGFSLPIQTPVEGLYSCGDACAPSGWWGSAAAVKSGRMVADDIAGRYR